MQIGLYRGKSLVSKIIRWQTDGPYSHANIILDDGRIIEAWHKPGRVRVIKTLSDGHTPGTEVDLFHLDVTTEQSRTIADFLTAQVGKGYDYRGVLRFISRSDRTSIRRWFCSEMVFAAFQCAGVYLLHVDAYKVSPTLLSYAPGLRYNRQIITK